VEPKLRLNEFKILYQQLRNNNPLWNHLLLGLLVWLENKVIDYRVTSEVTNAIKEYEKLEPPFPDYVTPIYTERPSEASVSLPEMRLTAPWYKEKVESN
jgi:hypothetical protein